MDENHYNKVPSIGETGHFKMLKKLSEKEIGSKDESKEFVADSFNMLSMYSTIYHGYTKAFNLEPVGILLLAIIATYSQNNRMCWHSQGTLAELTKSSIPTVIKHLKILEDLDLIERGPRHLRYRVVQWKLGPQGEYKMEEIQKRMRQSKEGRMHH
jgi:DNA-binding MarR family transcriptional regulator